MGSSTPRRRRRTLAPQALGSGEFLRVTWHEHHDVVVFSQWAGEQCTAAIPVRVEHLVETTSLLLDAVAGGPPAAWPAPIPEQLVVPAAGLSVPARRTA